MAEVIKTYRMRGGTDDRAGEISGVEYRDATEHMSLEETMWASVCESAPQDYEQRITVNEVEYDYFQCFADNKSVDEFKKEHGIDKITSMSYMDTPWSNLLSDIIQLEIVQEEPTDLTIWTVSSSEFNGWDNKLDTCSSTFTSKQDAVDWVNRNYESVMEDFFGQDPDADVDMELDLKESDFAFGYTVKTPDCENHYHTWNITGTVFKDFFKKKS